RRRVVSDGDTSGEHQAEQGLAKHPRGYAAAARSGKNLTVDPPEVLARRDRLPAKPAATVLRGPRVLLEPLDLDRDVEALHAISAGDDAMWEYMSGGPFRDPAAL